MLTHIVQKLPPEPLAEFIRLGKSRKKTWCDQKCGCESPEQLGRIQNLNQNQTPSIVEHIHN